MLRDRLQNDTTLKNNVLALVITTLSLLNVHSAFSQASHNYSIIETKNVLYYKVEEIVKMTFGGTTTSYTVSHLSLISKVNLGPDNIRIITPVYRDRNTKTKKFYIETRNLEKHQEPTHIAEIKVENNTITIPENSKIEKIALALALDNLTTHEKKESYKTKANPLKTDNPSKNTLRVKKNTTKSIAAKNQNDFVKPSKNPKDNHFMQIINGLAQGENATNTLNKDNNSGINIDNAKSKKNLHLETFANSKTDTKNVAVIEKKNQQQIALTLPTNNPVKTTPASTIKTEPIKEKANYVSINVTDVYERVAQKGYKSAYMFKEMANHYFFRNQMEKAAKWYEELFAMNTEVESIYYYRFGEALKKIGNTQKGDAMIAKFNKLVE